MTAFFLWISPTPVVQFKYSGASCSFPIRSNTYAYIYFLFEAGFLLIGFFNSIAVGIASHLKLITKQKMSLFSLHNKNCKPAKLSVMEVHHHPDLHHKKKHFKEYLLEFLMIFLAVTLGFLAENMREHITERSKEKEYIRGFIRNVQDDTANLRRIIDFDNRQVKGIDSFLHLSHANMKLDSNRESFYALAMDIFYNSSSFTSNNATLQQLKSTGDYRLIEKDHVADSLSKYDTDVQGIAGQTNYYNDYFKEILSSLEGLTDMTIYLDTSYIKHGKFTSKPLPNLSADSIQLRTFFNKVFDFRIITSSYAKNMLKPQLDNATRLISILKRTYGLDDE